MEAYEYAQFFTSIPKKYTKNFCQNFWTWGNMADWQENFSSPVLGEEETVLAIRLAEALRTDEVETFLEIYDSIPSTTETKRVSILITSLLQAVGFCS